MLDAKIAAGEPYDLAGPLVWISDYLDPFNTLGTFLGQGSSVFVNESQFNDPVFSRRLRAAQRIRGPGRYPALARLEADLLRTQAPYAPVGVSQGLRFVGPRVGCISSKTTGPLLESVCLRPPAR